MKRNLNKAFTLIELLAVIVILAIIALIATPIILGIVEDARKDSFERSVELVISTTDLDVASKNIQDGYTYEITDGTIPELEIGIKNIEGMNGTIVYDKEGKEQYAIHNGQYCVMKTEGMDKAIISEYEEGGCKLSITTSSKYFTYREIEPTYEIIDKEACQTFFVEEWGNTSEDATIICNNEPHKFLNGMPLTKTILDGFNTIDVIYLINVGAISYTGPEYEIADKDACIDVYMNDMNEWSYLEEAIVKCSPSSFTLIEHINLASEIGEEYFNGGYNDMLDAGAIVKNGSGKYELTNSCSTFLIQEWAYSELMANYYCNDGIWYSALTDDLKTFPLDEPGLLALKDSGVIKVNVPLEITGYSEEGPKNVIIPSTINGNTVVSIGRAAFYNKSLTSVSIPDTITSIGQYAFANNNLTQANKNEIVQINPSVVFDSTDASCFTYDDVEGGVAITGYKCADTDVIIPSTIDGNTVVSIGDFAFNDKDLTTVLMPDTITSIGAYAFQFNKLSGELDLSYLTSLTTIGSSAFLYNEISSIQLPEHVVVIGEGAFAHNYISGVLDLKDLVELEIIGVRSFSYASGITSIKLPANVTSIGDYAFAENNFHNLKFVTFYGRSDLMGITVPSSAFEKSWITGCDLTNCVRFVNEE